MKLKLSEELQQLHDCGDVGRAVEGMAETADKLESCLWSYFYSEACAWKAGHMEAAAYARERLGKITEL